MSASARVTADMRILPVEDDKMIGEALRNATRGVGDTRVQAGAG
jgi:hypothetical protein